MLFLDLIKIKNLQQDKNQDGFTVIEVLAVSLIIAILAAISLPAWQSFIDVRKLKTAQHEVYDAMREAQSRAVKEKLTWQVSFREQDSIVQWAVHPATTNPSNVKWNSLDSSVRLDPETTLQITNGVRQIKFEYMGNVKQPPLGRITLSSKFGGKAKRCVFVSTILGSLRMAKENSVAKNGDFCY